MKSCLSFLFALAASVAAAQSTLVVASPPQATYEVEVVAMDPSTRTISIRNNTLNSTLAVDPAALDAMRDLRPGDRVVITVRDGSTDRQQVVTTIVSGTGAARASAVSVTETRTVRGLAGSPVQVVARNPDAGTITVRSDDGNRIYLLDGKAAGALEEMAPGGKAYLSWRFNRAGQPEAVIRPAPASLVAVESSRPVTLLRPTRLLSRLLAGPVDVIAVDPDESTLTVRDVPGEEYTVSVDDKAVPGLSGLRVGDRIKLVWSQERVIYINTLSHAGP